MRLSCARGVAYCEMPEKKARAAQSLGWFFWMSDRADWMPALRCQQWASWQVPGHQLYGRFVSPPKKANIVIGPNQKCSRGCSGLSA